MINDFAPEDDPNTIGELMNWLGATSDQEQVIMDALRELMMGSHDMDDYFPSYEELEEFFAGLNMNLNFDDNVYNYLMNDFAPEDDSTTIDALMNMLGATSDDSQTIMDSLMEFYMEQMGGDMPLPDFDWLVDWFANMNLQYT